MRINWRVRIRNKQFWIAIIPAAIILIQVVMDVFGVKLDLSGLSEKLLNVVNAVFVILSILGIVADPTTEGMSDSDQALTYESPKKGAE